MNKGSQPNESKVLLLVRKVLDLALDGVGPLSSASLLAQEYELDQSYATTDARVDALIRWEATKNFTSGFLSGLGGIVTLPVTVPAALGASWVIQARLCGAIAELYKYSLREDRVRTLVLLALVGDSGKEILKEAGINASKRLTLAAIEKLPDTILTEINKRVGFRLLSKAGETGVINLTKLVPLLGGVVAGSLDATMCVAIGKTGKRIFRARKPERNGNRT